MDEIEVEIGRSKKDGSTFEDDKHAGIRGVVVSIRHENSPSEVVLVKPNQSDTDLIDVPSEYLKPIPPQKKDRFKVLGGDYKGQLGYLMGFDGEDSIVQLDSGTSYEIIPTRLLGKRGV